MIKVATVCTGIGAPEQSVRELGWDHEIVFGCEIDKYARTTYQANFQPHTLYEDMTAESWEGGHYYADLFVGGIPCQAFSLAGKRMGEFDPRGLLFYNFYDYVKKQQPKVFIIENIKGLLSDNNGKMFQNWIQLLARSVNTQEIMFPNPDSLGYNLHYKLLNAKYFGLPQNRERVFIVGIRKDLSNTFRFPVGWPLELKLKDVLEKHVSEKYYLSDKMVSKFLEKKSNSGEIKIEGEVSENSQAGKVYSEEGIMPTLTAGTHGYAMGYVNKSKLTPFGNSQEPYFLNGSTISKTIRAGGGQSMSDKHSFDMIIDPVCVRMIVRNPDDPKSRKTGEYRGRILGTDARGISCTLSAQGGGQGAKTGLYLTNEPKIIQRSRGNNKGGDHEICPTITKSSFENNNHVQYQKRLRRLTPRECLRLQGFPDSFIIDQVSETQAYKQAGNSIPVTVLKEILKNLKPLLG